MDVRRGPALPASARPGRGWNFGAARKGAVALLFATAIIPILGLVGLAVDYGIWNEAYSSLSLAASAAALNAAKVAASAKAQSDTNYNSEGVTAGKQWFLAELGQGSYAATAGTTPPVVAISINANIITATVSFTSSVNAVFGRLFRKATYPIAVTATATMSAGSYLEVVMMLDNSSSMDIGASPADMTTQMQQAPCDPSNEFTRTSSSSTYSQLSNQNYSLYQTTWQGGTYDGSIAYPITSGSLSFKVSTPSSSTTNIAYCNSTAPAGGTCAQVEQCPTAVNGYPAYAGPPCAFACHWDNSKAAGLGTDLWATARHNGITLRLDTVKNATNLVLKSMQSNNISSINNLSVGIYTFNTTVNPIYPGTSCTPKAFGCEAGSNWSTAISAVGLPPQSPSTYTDTGIQPVVAATGGVNDNTEIEEAMSTLANTYVTAAGNGATATTPLKVLFLITDGFEDDPTGPGYNGLRQAMPSSACTPFKTMGYTVYVIYTPYYPLMDQWYLQNGIPIAEGTGSDSISANLQACASNPNDYIAAPDQSALNNALLNFLTDALDGPATFTQ
jgi:Flp pilus assembly protein TadG